MKNEVSKVVELENEISVIEQSHKSAILSVHENMQQLVSDCLTIEIYEDDKQSYDQAVELKRIVKSTHVAIEKKRKELKQPLIDYGKRLDKWVEEIYSPLVNAEKIVKKKMEIYEEKQEKIKQERKIAEEKKQQEEILIDERLRNLNAVLEKINFAKTKKELNDISEYLDLINLSDFGKKSDEAGFILNQLRLTCSMASKILKDDEEKPLESKKLETTPITDELVDEIKESQNVSSNNVVQVQDIKIEAKNVVEPNLENSKKIFNDFNDKIEEEIKQLKATDDDVIEMIDKASNYVIKDVTLLINDMTKIMIENEELNTIKNFSDFKELIINEVKKRVGVLLNK